MGVFQIAAEPDRLQSSCQSGLDRPIDGSRNREISLAVGGFDHLCHHLPRGQRRHGGHDALGEVTLTVEHAGQKFRGRGISTDTVEATVQAILAAVNRIVQGQGSTTRRVD